MAVLNYRFSIRNASSGGRDASIEVCAKKKVHIADRQKDNTFQLGSSRYQQETVLDKSEADTIEDVMELSPYKTPENRHRLPDEESVTSVGSCTAIGATSTTRLTGQ